MEDLAKNQKLFKVVTTSLFLMSLVFDSTVIPY